MPIRKANHKTAFPSQLEKIQCCHERNWPQILKLNLGGIGRQKLFKDFELGGGPYNLSSALLTQSLLPFRCLLFPGNVPTTHYEAKLPTVPLCRALEFFLINITRTCNYFSVSTPLDMCCSTW